MHDRTIRWVSRSVLGVLALLGLAGGLLSACARQGGWSFPEAETWRRYSMRSGRPTLAPVRVADAKAGSRHEPPAGADVDPVAQGLFVRNCATCHGIDGSGQGPSVLDRPARNFKDGGFSFGNTADAIFNTISHGIPGTPMPAFDPSLAEDQRHRLAAYVRTLGPPVDDVDVAETILAVTEESGPLVVRGILPPIVEGAPIRPRGMLVGLPGGLSFEYRIDDVRLLGVRQGGFVERTDWRDRGGTPLKPLGGLIWTDAGGDPPATFTLECQAPDGTTRSEPLSARLVGTLPDAISYLLYRLDGVAIGIVIEGTGPTRQGSLTGFSRDFFVHLRAAGIDGAACLRLRIPLPEDSTRVESFMQTIGEERQAVIEWRVFSRPDGVHECIGTGYVGIVQLDARPALEESPGELSFVVPLPPGDVNYGFGSIASQHLFTASWSSAARAELQESIP